MRPFNVVRSLVRKAWTCKAGLFWCIGVVLTRCPPYASNESYRCRFDLDTGLLGERPVSCPPVPWYLVHQSVNISLTTYTKLMPIMTLVWFHEIALKNLHLMNFVWMDPLEADYLMGAMAKLNLLKPPLMLLYFASQWCALGTLQLPIEESFRSLLTVLVCMSRVTVRMSKYLFCF